MGTSYFDREGNSITVEKWATLFEDMDYRRIDHYQEGGYEVSTIWLGLDHSWDPEAPPIIFETLVITGIDEEELMYRYSTELEARAGHAEIVSMLESVPLEDLHESAGDGK